MAQITRNVKNLEAPRPLKSRSHIQSNNNNYSLLIEELIQLIENVAISLGAGINNPEPMALLMQNLRKHGPQLESVSKDTLDRSFVTFRNASQDERLNIMTRLNLLELIELRAKGWEDNGINTYYKSKATNVEPESANVQAPLIVDQSQLMSTSPTMMSSSSLAAQLQMHQQQQQLQQQQQQILSPGELLKNSGKFTRPTKIPGKNYCKDEVVIRNADSGKVMGIKGRRVHMIEELSETIISFQKVNPGAKERLVQITGPSEDKINYAKQLIEDTIRRNASPVRLEPTMNEVGAHGGGAAGSCSSLASSASDEVTPRSMAIPAANRASFGSAAVPPVAGSMPVISSVSTPITQGKSFRSNNANQMLLHSFSTNDATLGEYKYTVNVGQHLLKITGDCCELVRVAKLVLDDYFSSNEFLASVEAGAAFDGSNQTLNSTSTPTTPLCATLPGGPFGQPETNPFIPGKSTELNYMAGQFAASNSIEGDDDVFADMNVTTPVNGLTRSRRSHFSRKDSSPEVAGATSKSTSDGGKLETVRIVYEPERLLYYAKNPHSWSVPADWQRICEKVPSIIRNKVNAPQHAHYSNSTSLPLQKNNPFTSSAAAGNGINFQSPSVVRKGFFNRNTFSIDEGFSSPSNACTVTNNDSIKGNDEVESKLTRECRSNSTCD